MNALDTRKQEKHLKAALQTKEHEVFSMRQEGSTSDPNHYTE